MQKSLNDKNQIKLKTSVCERESYVYGRIAGFHFSDILKTRSEAGFSKKIPGIASKANTSEYLLRHIDYIVQTRSKIGDMLSIKFEECGTIIHELLPYICTCPDGRFIHE